jgi:hypothetical protein
LRAALLTLCLLATASAPRAGVVSRVETRHESGRYALELDMDLDAPPARVQALALDHDGLHRLSSAIVESQRLPPLATDPERRRVVYRACFLIHCFTATMVESIRFPGPGHIHTDVEPALSDFRAGHSDWYLTPLSGGRTRVTMQVELEPRFWVPPVVGPWLIKRKMLKAAEETGHKLEALARDE